ncbi:MAG TPA: T9SS type A sorting domain-containing protein [Candidatus Kapabacteria bacterium]|nr:T9SS type A sorting domain-containing protein [Candidatus Kapabacteria bacterium]
MLLRLALVTLLFLLSNTSRAQKNTLHLWVDTLIIDETQNDVILNVKFWLDVKRPPVKFYGYVAEIDYGPSGYVQVVGNNGVIFQNTGSRHIPDPIPTVTTSWVRVVALGDESQRVDTNYTSLFKLRLAAANLPAGERALFIWDYIQLVEDSGIDSVIYGQGYVERRKNVPEPVFDTVRIAIPGHVAQSDSTFDLPVVFDSIAGSKVKHFAFSFDFDSSVVRLDDVIKASDIVDTLERDIQPTHGDVFMRVAGDGVIQGADTLFYLRFTAKHRTDTLCTMLQQVGFLPINDDVKVDATVISLSEICVQGKAEDPVKSVEVSESLRDLWIGPNPASEFVTVMLPESVGRFEVAVYDVMGRLVYSSRGIGKVEWRPGSNARGAYHIVVTTGTGSTQRQVIIR